MKLSLILLILTTIIINIKLIVAYNINIDDNTPIINTKNGRVKGYTKQLSYKDRKVYIYEGIRYGKPPIGELRFKPSVPVDNWMGIYNANGYRNACMHSLVLQPDNQLPETKYQSEDCLFLNVVRPTKNLDKKLPVMFWIHGGGYETGTIFSLAYDASYVAGVGDVIVVAVNYRLGIFGFMYADDDDAPGNYGLYDQILALKWTHDNIEQFGGDPNEITIFGESAGSMSVANLILSPLTKGLFKRAIMQSGSANSWLGSIDKYEALKKTKLIAGDLKCSLDNIKEMLKCLRNATADQIVDVNKYGRMIGNVFSPAYGTKLLPNNPVQALKNGNFNQDVDLIFGVNRDEGSVFTEALFPNLLSPKIENPKLTLTNVRAMIELMFGIFKEKNPSEVADFYLKNVSDSDINALRHAVTTSFGDYHLICPTIFFGETFARYSKSNNVYGYFLTHKPSLSGLLNCIGYMGVCHGDDLVFLFGFPIKLRGTVYSEEDYHISIEMIKAWSDFARYGKPGNFGSIEWKPTLSEQMKLNKNSSASVLDIDIRGKYRMIDNNFVSVCENFWRQRIFA